MNTKKVIIAGQQVDVPVKHWYQSKQIWLGIITALIGIASLLEQQYGMGIFATAGGILQIILRTISVTAIASNESDVVG